MSKSARISAGERWISARPAAGNLPKRRQSKFRKSAYAYPDPPDPPLVAFDPLDGYAFTTEDPDKPKTQAANERRYRRWLGRARHHRTGPYAHRRSWLYEMIVLANDTGKRIGSIRHLRVGDIHLDDRDLRKRPFGTITWPAKYDKQSIEWERVPILTARARRAIVRTLGRLERYNLPTDSNAWLFPTVNSFVSPVSKKTAGLWLRWADERAQKHFDMPPLKYNTKRWHSLRAKWATERKDAKNQVEIAWTGGWKSVATLTEFYQKIEPELAFEAAALAA